jgi:two-component system sensor histidine kinase RpfC
MVLWGLRRLRPLLRMTRTQLLERSAGEREISINRLVFGCVALVYVAALTWIAGLHSSTAWSISIAYLCFGLALFFHIRRWPARSPRRRYVALLIDVVSQTVALAALGRFTSPMYSIYLWLILGYAFRFGIPYLRVASVLSVIGFSGVALTVPYWKAQPFLAVGLGIGLLIIPIYLEALLKRILVANAQVEAVTRSKGLILSCVSHELQAPLTAIVGLNDLLTGTNLNPKQRDIVKAVQVAAKSVLSDLDDLLELSRIEAERMSVVNTAFRLTDLVSEVTSLARAMAYGKGLQVDMHIAASAPLMIATDRRHLRNILLNLLSNAVKFTELGSVLVTVGVQASPSRLRFEVSDTGIGIPADVRVRIFESFQQADSEILGRYGGNGLGLTVSQQLTELLGGAIGVGSQAGQGSTLWLELPMQSVVHVEPVPIMSGIGVVLLSQEPARVRDLAARLERLGAKSFVTDKASGLQTVLADGAEGLDRFVVVLDGQGVDAAELASVVRQNTAFRSVPLVLLAETLDALPLAVRRHFVTAVSRLSSDRDLRAALTIAGPAVAPVEDGPDGKPGARPTPCLAVRPLHILIADDSRTSQLLLTKVLEQAGHTVKAVGSGDEALAAVADETFDLALIDVSMPGMNGIDTTQMIRFASSNRPHLPVIGLTESNSPYLSKRCAAAGMDSCIAKPVDHVEFLRAVSAIVPVPPAKEDTAALRSLDPQVTPISIHPQFKAAPGPAIDGLVATQLDSLADAGAAPEIAEGFETEVGATLRHLESAVDAGDVLLFRMQLRALQGMAASVGAGPLGALCSSGDAIEVHDLHRKGRELLTRITREANRARERLDSLG